MKRTTVQHGKILLLAALMGMFLMGSPASSFAQPATIAVRGKIASLTGQELIVSSANGDVKTILTHKTVIRAETPIQLSEISSGMYLGTTATKQADGTFLASEVHVFSEDQRGTGEGHRPLGSAPQSGATMTNANVEHVEDVEIKDIRGRLVSLKYKDGAVKVVVPPNIPLVKRVRSDRSALKKGVEVSLQGAQSPDGALAAAQITVRAEGR
jgi:Domain of unknown function (DUF5666)